MESLLSLLCLAAVYAKVDYLGDAARPHPRDKAPAEVTVVVDPGHGGDEKGARSFSGRWEKDVNLLLAKELRAALTNLGYRVVMTREGDRTVGLYERPAVAVLNDADAFISVHHNAPAEGKDPMSVRYKSVYSWNPLGESLSRAIADELRCEPLHANFAVTRNPEAPSVLVEADFISHPLGERDSWNASVRRTVAAGIARGFARWCGGRDGGASRGARRKGK